MEASLNTSYEVLIRRPQVIRKLTGWTDLVDINTIRAYLVGDHNMHMYQWKLRKTELQKMKR